jgi:hypothetical protein
VLFVPVVNSYHGVTEFTEVHRVFKNHPAQTTVYKLAYGQALNILETTGRNEEIGRLLNHMINNPEKY